MELELEKRISKIRYKNNRPGNVIFDFDSTWKRTGNSKIQVEVLEPRNVTLVGRNDEKAAQWIVENYSYLLKSLIL